MAKAAIGLLVSIGIYRRNLYNEFEFNSPCKGKSITEINGVDLPQNYFIIGSNGGGEFWESL